jgi:peptidoglycan/xylan/chitin deacetylase (PgdA/CDA1 family)
MFGYLATGAAVLGAATYCGFQAYLPASQLYGRSFHGLARGSRQLALSFDDGPNGIYTSRLLDLLAEKNVKATFFVLGSRVAEYPTLARRIVDEGHAIGNHSWDHPNMIFASRRELVAQIERTQAAIEEATGIRPLLFRPGFGARRPQTLRTVRALGMSTVLWRVTCYDWEEIPVEKIVAHARRQIRGGEVILLHDGEHHASGVDRSRSIEATGELMEFYRGKGFEFLTVPEMMARGGWERPAPRRS